MRFVYYIGGFVAFFWVCAALVRRWPLFWLLGFMIAPIGLVLFLVNVYAIHHPAWTYDNTWWGDVGGYMAFVGVVLIIAGFTNPVGESPPT